MALDGKVTVPGIGPQPKKAVLIFGGITAGIVGYAWWRHRTATAAATTADPAATGDNTGGLVAPGSLDPNAYDPSALGGGYDSTGSPVTSQQFTTNAQWSQAAADYLIGTLGSDPATVGAALGRYIHGDTLTTGQQSVVSAAIAFENYPPVSGANGRPPAMNVSSSPAPQPSAPKRITANGNQTLWQLAHAAGITEQQIVYLNPGYAWYVGSKKNIPKGRTLRIVGPPRHPVYPPKPRTPHPSPNKAA